MFNQKRHLTFNRLLASLLLLGSTLGFTSCERTSDPAPITYEHGVLVVNEGNFQQSNGSISYYNPASGVVQSDIFRKVNDRPLGDVVQSMTDHQDRSYIVVNNSNKVEVVEAVTFRSVAVIEGLLQPRYLVATGNKAFVTEWGEWGKPGQVSVLDLTTNTVTNTIPVGLQPEKMLLASNGMLYVTNSGANTLTVINPATETVESTITVGDSPNSLVEDAAGAVWVLCGGQVAYNADWTIDYTATTPGSLIRFSPATPTEQEVLVFGHNQSQPSHLVINREKDRLHYLFSGQIYQMSPSATALPATALIGDTFYGLGVDPSDNTIYGADTRNFQAAGQVTRYSPGGEGWGSFPTDIGPREFVFRP